MAQDEAVATTAAGLKRAGYKFKDGDTDQARLQQFQLALRVCFASLGNGFHSSDTAHELLRNMRGCGIPEDVLKDCAEHFAMNRSSFMQGFMG